MTGDFGFVRKTQTGKPNDSRGLIVFVKLRFQNGFRPKGNEKRAFLNSFGLKTNVFEKKLRFRDGLVKTSRFSDSSGVAWMRP